MNNKMTNEFTDRAYQTSRNERPTYINFAASKMSQCVKPNSIVEFVDFMGRKHKVACRNNSEIKRQMKFFSMLKKESLMINQIITSFPLSYGLVEKKFLSECKRELKGLGLSKRAIDIVLG